MADDELTPERPREGWDGAVEITPRVLPTCIVLGPHEFEDPLVDPLHSFGRCLVDSVLNPERAQPKPYARPAPPTSLAELATRSDWKSSDCYCVHCGQQPVIVEAGDGDYYLGPEYLCLSCQGTFRLG